MSPRNKATGTRKNMKIIVEVQFHAFLTSAQMEVTGQPHAPDALHPGKEAPHPMYRGLDGLWSPFRSSS
jgi:hypothetical protein